MSKSIFIRVIFVKTYLLVWFNSEGASPSEVNRRLLSLGFKPIQGYYDYVYEWGNNVHVEDILQFGDKVHLSLNGLGVIFKIETIDGKK
ncbi:hypothetical protein C7960_1660 [Methanohalophilus euhalobius]|jgi:hypothetical protein|uniref:Uncharacterized protein n=1 Tax=Methanohalophilus euhalobius TaxID=51203 RepID=A0A285G967_9EURY|nr:MAG: hypothetical protein A8273_1403 [Methanohalophilus sp. 2-GBenrich]RSD34223.1 MAG: hypothetical protein CI953_1002 [Methanohalophilus sp.]RXG34916.1 hypothetical protein CI957_510 [Methanohalophilus sp. WG1-DM]TCL12409.1 hypothetical protein C7960_1660 [Methanohalophilus euhalobius]RSD36431.1 MAG: hypothetical protein CI952_130 [Methanohalophilus sp.]